MSDHDEREERREARKIKRASEKTERKVADSGVDSKAARRSVFGQAALEQDAAKRAARRAEERTEREVEKATEVDAQAARRSIFGQAALEQEAAAKAREEQARAAAPAPQAAPPAQPVAEPAPTTRSHTVASGETLGHIAKRYYGEAAQWRRIYEANRDKIQNPDLIYPGQEFIIPQ